MQFDSQPRYLNSESLQRMSCTLNQHFLVPQKQSSPKEGEDNLSFIKSQD